MHVATDMRVLHWRLASHQQMTSRRRLAWFRKIPLQAQVWRCRTADGVTRYWLVTKQRVTHVRSHCPADWGGTIAWTTAITYPEVVEKLVTCCGAHPELYFRNMDADQKKRCGMFGRTSRSGPVLPL